MNKRPFDILEITLIPHYVDIFDEMVVGYRITPHRTIKIEYWDEDNMLIEDVLQSVIDKIKENKK